MKNTKTNTTQTNNTTKKIMNWSEYDQSLQNRGDFTVLLNVAYLNSIPKQTGKAGHPVEYTDAVILFLAQLREFMRLPLRQTIGTAKFILKLAGLELRLPNRSTLSRRLGRLSVPTGLASIKFDSPIIFLPDSTGLKISGEGEWKVRKHGTDKRRKWVKLHIGVDHTTQMIVSSCVTPASSDDGQQLKHLLKTAKVNCSRGKGKKILASVIADGAYDGNEQYKMTKRLGVALLVPPPKNAVWHGDIKDGKLVDEPGWETRNSYVRSIVRLGRDDWKRESGYHKRSLAETAMYRLKQTFGSNLKSRSEKNQIAEVNVRISLLNLFTSYGLPRYAT